MLLADYFVITVPLVDKIEAALPGLKAYWLPDPQPFSIYGYRGERSGKVFIGDNGQRVLLQATGRIAHDVATTLSIPEGVEYSVARIDVQITMVVRDADVLINSCQPSKAYKAVRWLPVGEPGATLYVGAPSSNCRLRLYNKTAESGIRPEWPGDFLRVELQFRNRYADRMFLALRARAPKFPFLSHLRKMVDAFTFDMVKHEVERGESELFPEEPPVLDDAIARRKMWLERSVIPAIRKLVAMEPEYLDVFVSMLYNLDDDREDTF